MPRSPDGTYSLPLADVAPGETISSTWANSTMNDVAAAMSDSLDRDGNGGMRAPLLFGDGAEGAPGITWSNEPSTGLYRGGTGDMRVSVLGSDLFRWNNGKAQQWDTTGSAWADVLTTVTSGGTYDFNILGDAGSVSGYTISVVEALPGTPVEDTLYFVTGVV